MHRSGGRPDRLRDGAAREAGATDVARRSSSGGPGSWNQRTARPKRVGLVDRLPRARAAQLGRAVGGAHEQRDPRVMRLDHGRVQVGGRGSRRAAHDAGRPVASPRPSARNAAERSSSTTSTVDPTVAHERKRSAACSANPGETTARDHSGADPLVDQRHGERGGHVEVAHPGHNSENARGSCSFRASPRLRARGAACMRRCSTSRARSCAVDVPVRETFAATARAIGARGRRAIYAGYSMGGRLVPAARARPARRSCSALVLVSVARHRRPRRRAPTRVASDEDACRGRSSATASTRSSTSGSRSRCSRPSRRRAGRRRAPRAARPRTSRTACACSARARWNRCGSELARAEDAGRARDRAADDQKYDAIADADARTDCARRRARAARRRSRAAAREPRRCSAGSSPSFAAAARLAQPQPDREQHREHELEAHRADQRGDEAGRIVRVSIAARRDASGAASNASNARADERTRTPTTATSAPTMHADVEQPGRGARRCGRRACACPRHDRSRRRARCSRAGSRTRASPTASAAGHATPGTCACCTYALPSVATKPKNTSTMTSPRPEVAVRLRSARVGDRGEDRGGADEQQPRVHDERQDRADDRGDRERR